MEDLEFDSIEEWATHGLGGELASGLGPYSLSAPPVESPELEDLPAFPARLPSGNASATGRVRLQGKAFFLTYSQSALERQTVVDWFSRQQRVKRFIVGREHHQDGNLHWHVTIEYDCVKDVRRPQYFDINGEHPNCGIWTRSREQTFDEWFYYHWRYCKKEDPTPHIVGRNRWTIGSGRETKVSLKLWKSVLVKV